MRRFFILIEILLLAGSFCLVYAQAVVATGAVRGAVSDPSGAVIAGAQIALISRATGQKSVRSSNADGIFVFPSQAVGAYAVEVSAAGFREKIVDGVYVEVGQPTTIDVHLQPGAGKESITVSGESPLLRIEDSNQSSVVN